MSRKNRLNDKESERIRTYAWKLEYMYKLEVRIYLLAAGQIEVYMTSHEETQIR